MKYYELLTLIEDLRKVDDLRGAKFTYAVDKNTQAIERELKSLYKIREPKKDYQEFEKVRIDLCKSHAKKDERDQPIIEDGKYQLVDEEKWRKEFEELKKKHKKAIDGYEAQIQDYNKFLQNEAKLKIHFVREADVPEEISVSQRRAVRFMIKD